MKVRYSRNALKFLSKLDAKSVERIRAAIAGLTEKPPRGDIKLMQGYSDDRMRLRVGGWRVVYRLERDGRVEILLVMEIGNRGDIYK
ncbi:type II toxin-antitoxin system RelE/ParE family toxin [Neglecta sp. X4]|uniref:type II toxin-antitoxin system RelE family toxin n=1 Tax=unclassified Neglectibacter TaxID=2632164 RepID=UPI001371485D|nr:MULTISPECIES: type II toxin-antitoxin system RelE/ParE family toxin [unclassified Neglectibacter]NBI18852.1 type II toxin-antitoxin system RelE/ParE family toxin [Neglectibacter sp. 59]NBJ74537.1 type II toxin-antitoxin system RelE/ParE family toxin [Neglectibacter sp. X4]NCE82205.1 type II toxin-antitoxin system RelE/ParE family toxin [Neglectibacter sp. X58]